MDAKTASIIDKKTILTENVISDFTTDGEITVQTILDTKQDALCLKYTSDLELLAVGFTDGFVRVFKPQKKVCSHSLIDNEILQNPAPVTCIKHRRFQKNKADPTDIFATYVNGCVKCWDLTTGECIFTIHENRQTLGIAYCPKMPKFVTVGADGRVILYDEEKKCQERVYKSSGNAEVCDGHTSRVYAACFHPDNPYEFMTGGWDDTVLYWDIRQPAPSRHLSGIHICGEGLDISATGREVLTCAWQRDNQMKLWDYNSGRLIRDLHPDVENSKLYCGKWLTKDLIIAGGSELNLIRVADVYKDITIAMIQGLPKGVYSLDKGPMEPRRSQVKKVNIKYSTEPKELPKVAFCAGKRIYEFIFK